ncbi:hypothetical protein NL676_011504 [Syzygium grande]|nr:hypothetical protein NL676_011504 [Syzygium grande]
MEIEVLHRSDLGGSLPVKNVQALASKGLKEVPPRYLRPASELGEVCDTESLEIPVIDMIKLGKDHPDHSDEIEKFHWACKEWGFLQLINHGISEEFIHQVKTNTEEFFQLPLEEKPSKAMAKLLLCRKTRSLTGATCSSFLYSLLPRETSGFGQRTLPLSGKLKRINHTANVPATDSIVGVAIVVRCRAERSSHPSPVSDWTTLYSYSNPASPAKTLAKDAALSGRPSSLAMKRAWRFSVPAHAELSCLRRSPRYPAAPRPCLFAQGFPREICGASALSSDEMREIMGLFIDKFSRAENGAVLGEGIRARVLELRDELVQLGGRDEIVRALEEKADPLASLRRWVGLR